MTPAEQTAGIAWDKAAVSTVEQLRQAASCADSAELALSSGGFRDDQLAASWSRLATAHAIAALACATRDAGQRY